MDWQKIKDKWAIFWTKDKMDMAHKLGYWRTADGRLFRPEELENNHLINIWTSLEVQARNRAEFKNRFRKTHQVINGLAIDQYMREHPLFYSLNREIKKRKLDK